MNILSVLRLVLSIADTLIGYAKDRQLLSAGEALYASKSLARTSELVSKALAARRRVKHDAVSVRDDPDNRDRS